MDRDDSPGDGQMNCKKSVFHQGMVEFETIISKSNFIHFFQFNILHRLHDILIPKIIHRLGTAERGEK